MPTKQPVSPPENRKQYVRIRPGHSHANRVGVLGQPVKILTNEVFYFVQFSDGEFCYAKASEFEKLQPTSPPPPRKQ
jgi:hypothetical protein